MKDLNQQIHTEVPESLYQQINPPENSMLIKFQEETPTTTSESEQSPVLENGLPENEITSESNNFSSETELNMDFITKTLEEQQIPCSVCRESITSADGVRVGDKFYHRNCFVCGICNRYFDPSDEIFIGKDNKILCVSCKIAKPEEIKTLDVCVYCKKPLGSAAMVALNYKWHPECFVCADCGVVLTGFFRDTDGVPYCEPCWLRNFAKICNKCGEPIGEQVMTIEDNHYHVDCVKCSVCNKSFDNVLDILAIDSDFWHVDCFKEAESESDSESTCSTSSALLGIYNHSLGFSANTSISQANSNSGNKKSRKISTVSFTPAPKPKSLQGEEGVMSPVEVPVTSYEAPVTSSEAPVTSYVEISTPLQPEPEENTEMCEPLLRPQSNCSTKQSTCCVIS